MAARCKAWTVFARSNTEVVVPNPTRDMDVCVRLFFVCVVLCVGSGLATGWSPVQGVLPTVHRIMELQNQTGPNKGLYEGFYLSIYLSMVLRSFLLDLGRFFNFLILYTVGRTPWTGISPSQGRYLHTEQHKQNKRTQTHAFSGIRTQDPGVRASEGSSCLRPRGHCDRLNECF
jgi:hypothetical protein